MSPEELFDKYQRLAHWYVYRFLPTRMDDEDYHQTALLGLWRACRSYDCNKNSSFTTYAVACIRNEFSRYHRHIHREKREGDLHLCSLDKLIPGDSTEDRESSISEAIGDPNSLKDYETLFDKEFLEYMHNNRYTTKNQKKLIDLICRGYDTGEIVKELGVSRQRVYQVKGKLKEKFGKEYYHE